MIQPKYCRPQFSTDQAATYFYHIPAAKVIAGVLDIDLLSAAWLRAVAVRLPFDQGVTWLNDVAEALARDYPFHAVMVCASSIATYGLIWKRGKS